MINRLMLFVVNTGVLTSCCAVASLIALVASPATLIYASFYFCIGRLYTNSLLATLNARQVLTGKVEDVSHMLVSMPSTLLNSQNGLGRKNSKSTKAQNISIHIERSTIKDGEAVNISAAERGLDVKAQVDEFGNHDLQPSHTSATHRNQKRTSSIDSDPLSYV